MKCDFLSVSIDEPGLVSDSSSAAAVTSSAPSAVSLVRGSYHVVVFSLFLSYLPDCRQRLGCCVKAHQLLRVHGLLLVITPDSSHQNKHVAMMRNWKRSIEAIGFYRYRYTKQPHLHCMAFRKTSSHSHTLDSLDQTLWDGLCIPQDRSPAQTTGNQASQSAVGSGESATVDTPPMKQSSKELFCELPFSEAC